ncbi:MAG: class I SAM-dependent methyltransferase [Planctomycetia bacterium]|nr:class I SAM-dependent methyltransferase [Planctomycetia bacterium]
MSGKERRHWDLRYATEEPRAKPSRLLTPLGRLLPRRGRALDVAGGSGRNAIWLAKRGLDVTIADISRKGLAMARRRARDAGVRIRTVALDLDAHAPPRGPWDLILVFHWLRRRVWKRLPALLRPGGVLVACQATVRNLDRHGRPHRRHLLREGEMAALFPPLEVLALSEGWSKDGKHDALFAGRLGALRKRPSNPPPEEIDDPSSRVSGNRTRSSSAGSARTAADTSRIRVCRRTHARHVP